jgi:GTP-binding protein
MVRPELENRGYRVFEVSAVTREGLKELVYALGETVEAHRLAHPPQEATRAVVRPRAVDETGFTIERDDEGVFVVRGVRVERWVRQTSFDNDEAIGYLADRLDRLGVEEALVKKGAQPGDPVRIGTHEFDWQPNAGEFVSGPRGTDARLEEQTGRASAAQRLAARKARRVRSDDELLHMSADGTVTSVANSQRPVLFTEDEAEDADGGDADGGDVNGGDADGGDLDGGDVDGEQAKGGSADAKGGDADDEDYTDE